ncbi:hypothetical protein E4U53_006564 [Claviceps sorghi]|nr:hypothetical protein E4U53_006564 [Claviceps sorghi]
MRFSASAALAAMAIYAGQTLAVCTNGVVSPTAGSPSPCRKTSANSWTCKDGSFVGRTGNTFKIVTRNSRTSFGIWCSNDVYTSSRFTCPANSAGTVDLTCPGNNREVSVELWIPAGSGA